MTRHGAGVPGHPVALRRLSLEDGSERRSAVRLVRPFHGARREGHREKIEEWTS